MQRPVPVTLIGLLYLVSGALGLIYHLGELHLPLESGPVIVLLLRLSAMLGGFFVLRGANWARWLLMFWIGYHLGLSLFHNLTEIIMHGMLFLLTGWMLFNRKATTYFKS